MYENLVLETCKQLDGVFALIFIIVKANYL